MSAPNANLTQQQRIVFPVDGKGRFKILSRDSHGEIPFMRDVEEFTAAYMTPGTKERKAMELATTPRDRTLLATLRVLQHFHSYPKSQNAERELFSALSVILGSWSPDELGYGDMSKIELAAKFFGGSLNDGMRGAQPVMLPGTRGGMPTPGIWCPDIKTAAFVWAAFRGVAVCCVCRNLFAPDPLRDEKPYCPKCAQAYWQREYRKRNPGGAKSTKRRKEKKR